MRRLAILAALAVLLAVVSAGAQDPGAPDSIIIGSDTIGSYYTGQTLNIPVYLVTDDTITFLNFPIELTASTNLLQFNHTIWRDNFRYWDECYDSVVNGNQLLRQVAWCDLGGADNPPIYTNGQRVVGLELRVRILADFLPWGRYYLRQGSDPINGGILFGTNTAADIRPVFVPGYIWLLDDIDEMPQTPLKFALNANYPNPFNSSTTISYVIPSESKVTLEIYDILGKRITSLVNQQQQPGTYQVNWNAADMPSGAYFARLKAGEKLQTTKMILMK
jgi:hypothetical protein